MELCSFGQKPEKSASMSPPLALTPAAATLQGTPVRASRQIHDVRLRRCSFGLQVIDALGLGDVGKCLLQIAHPTEHRLMCELGNPGCSKLAMCKSHDDECLCAHCAHYGWPVTAL
jgi:hypothetical protein